MNSNASGSLGTQTQRRRVLAVLKDEDNRRYVRAATAVEPSMVLIGVASELREINTDSHFVPPDIIIVDSDAVLIDEIAHYRRWIRQWATPIFVLSQSPDTSEKLRLLEAQIFGFHDGPGGAIVAAVKNKGQLPSKFVTRLKDALAQKPPRPNPPAVQQPAKRWNGRIVLIGASTGGVGAIETLLSELTLPAPPILITQHMPKTFLQRFADRLNDRLELDVHLAQHNENIEINRVYLAPGGHDHLTISPTKDPRITIKRVETGVAYNPSIELMMQSAVPLAKRVIAVMLTGMGSDGVKGMTSLHQDGALCFAQDRASSTVYGMPRAAAESGIIDEVLPVEKIALRLNAETTTASMRSQTA